MGWIKVVLGLTGIFFIFVGTYFVTTKKIEEGKEIMVKLLGTAYVVIGAGGIALVVLL